ncbi:MAG: SDR family NAD(P)-dependent oxidoreductase [Proteobacteria bacterium]|nr:SDR family NAD(P)-dependent oxidoreductase [Pseudomonadota bacterium]
MNEMDLKKKTVFITGASSGIGKELSRGFAFEGANLVIASLPHEKEILETWANELRMRYHIDIWTLTGDLAAPGGPEAVYESVKSMVPHIDVLVNNAGIIAYGDFHERPLEVHERIVAVNLRAYMSLMRLFLPDMIKRKRGHIFNVSSVSAFVPTPNHAVYGATKAFVQSLSEAVHRELRDTGVKIFTLNPGYTDTPLLKGENFPETLWFYKIVGKSDPATIARQGIDAFKQGKLTFIPGRRLRFLFTVSIRLTPRRLLNYLSELMLKGV